MTSILSATNLNHFYGERKALNALNLEIVADEMFVLLGPNGGGKTTAFKIFSTLLPIQRGEVSIFGRSLKSPVGVKEIRRKLGVVFQTPALDKKLTVGENLRFQGALYDLSGEVLRSRVRDLLKRLDVGDRIDDRVETLSGGLKRRVEIAKALLHRPKLLILDEPTTGLDPLARKNLWDYLKNLRQEEGLTILLTTHLLDEAENASRIAILDRGQLVALGIPQELKERVGAEVISLKGKTPAVLKEAIEKAFQLKAEVVDDEVRVQKDRAHEFIPELVGKFSSQIQSVTIGKPTLEDLFILKTGHRFGTEPTEAT